VVCVGSDVRGDRLRTVREKPLVRLENSEVTLSIIRRPPPLDNGRILLASAGMSTTIGSVAQYHCYPG